MVPTIIIPSRPMFTIPARSDHSPPSPASAIGIAEVRVTRSVPEEVSSWAPLSTRTSESSTTPASTYRRILFRRRW